ncbi:beta-carotene hydroxylase [Arthrospira sp. PCC 8006]
MGIPSLDLSYPPGYFSRSVWVFISKPYFSPCSF